MVKKGKANAVDLPPAKLQKPKVHDRNAALLKEISALGGSEADLALVAGLDSDTEHAESSKSTSKGKDMPANELRDFVKALGFDQLQRQDAESDAGESEDDDDDSESESASSEAVDDENLGGEDNLLEMSDAEWVSHSQINTFTMKRG